MEKYLEAGRIINTHGVNGVIKLDPWCDSPEVAAALKRIYLKTKDGYREYKVERASIMKQFVLMKLEDIDSLDDALRYKNRKVYADRDDIPLSEGAVFVADILGLPVIDADDGRIYGNLKDVNNHGAGDIYEIELTDGGSALVPAVDEFVIKVDPESGVYIRPIPGLMDGEL